MTTLRTKLSYSDVLRFGLYLARLFISYQAVYEVKSKLYCHTYLLSTKFIQLVCMCILSWTVSQYKIKAAIIRKIVTNTAKF